MRHYSSTLFVGPFPPPTHGQSLVTERLSKGLAAKGLASKTIDTSEGQRGSAFSKLARKLAQNARSWIVVLFARGSVYVSLNSNVGLWLSVVLCALARLTGKRIFVHHHSYACVRQRARRMVALARTAGPDATHIVLGSKMARELRASTPEAKQMFVLNNAGFVDDPGAEQDTSADGEIVLGHMSNLTAEKGIGDVVALAHLARQQGLPVRLVVAGPANADAQAAIDYARSKLGRAFEYLGPVYGSEKRSFLDRISIFVFPTRYHNEASPLVLLEAMASGVPCLSYDRGCIADDIGPDGGLVISSDEDFSPKAVAYLKSYQAEPEQYARRARRQFERLLSEHQVQVAQLSEALSQP